MNQPNKDLAIPLHGLVILGSQDIFNNYRLHESCVHIIVTDVQTHEHGMFKVCIHAIEKVHEPKRLTHRNVRLIPGVSPSLQCLFSISRVTRS